MICHFWGWQQFAHIWRRVKFFKECVMYGKIAVYDTVEEKSQKNISILRFFVEFLKRFDIDFWRDFVFFEGILCWFHIKNFYGEILCERSFYKLLRNCPTRCQQVSKKKGKNPAKFQAAVSICQFFYVPECYCIQLHISRKPRTYVLPTRRVWSSIIAPQDNVKIEQYSKFKLENPKKSCKAQRQGCKSRGMTSHFAELFRPGTDKHCRFFYLLAGRP